tara:strand:+ start:114 stop:752 length:639 start_codon:yes stop_codon:yes gene_type:complete
MGESPSGSDSSMSNQQLNKAKKNREAKEQEQSRNKAFDTYKQYPGDMLQTDKRVLDNIKIATDLENKARTSQINLPVPTLGSIAMNTVSSINYNNQAKQLRGGGNPVFDDKGDYQGVVGKGTFGGKVYSGNADYSPIGRSQGSSFNSATGTYTSSKMQSTGGDDNSQSSNNTPSNTQTTAIDKTDSTTSLSTASRRALISGGGGGATRRNLI